MTREELGDKMKDLPNPPMRVHLIQQVYDIMNEENEKTKRQLTEAKEIIYDFYDSCKGNGTTCVNTGTRFIDFLELVKKAEVFLKKYKGNAL